MEIRSRESAAEGRPQQAPDDDTVVRPVAVGTNRDTSLADGGNGKSGAPMLKGVAIVGVLGALVLGYFAITDSRMPWLQPEPDLDTASSEVPQEQQEPVQEPESEPEKQPEVSLQALQDDSEASEQSFRDELAALQEANQALKAGLESLQSAKATQAATDAHPEQPHPEPVEVNQEPAEPVITYTLVVQTLDIRNCKGIAGRLLSRFGAKDEPSVAVNGTTIWPESPKSLSCPKEYPVETRTQLPSPGANVLTVHETDLRGGNPVVMGMITEPVARARQEECLDDTGVGGKICTTEFNAHDGQYVLTWRVEANAS